MATSADKQSRPVLFEARSSETFITFVVSFSVFTLVPVTPATLRERVGLPAKDAGQFEEQRWTSILLALYGVGELVCARESQIAFCKDAKLIEKIALAGYIADRIESRKWPFMVGLILLGGGCALLCVGTNLAFLICGRLLQGASAAVVWAVGRALLVDSVARERLGQHLGYLGTGMAMGTMVGPLLGGVIYKRCGYYAVFGLAFAMVGLDIVLRIVVIEKKGIRDEVDSSNSDSAACSQLKSKSGDEFGTLDPVCGEKPTAAKGEKEEGVRCPGQEVQRRQRGPLMVLLRSERMWATIWGYFVLSMILSCFDSVLPLFVEDTFGWSQLDQGLIFLPLSIPNFLGPVFGHVNDRFGKARRYLAAGSFLGATVACVLLRLISQNTIKWKVVLCVLLALLGLSLAALVPCMLSEIGFIVLEEEERKPGVFGKVQPVALVYGILSFVFAAGSIVGPFLAGFIRESAGWNTMTWVLGLIAGVSAIPMLLLGGLFVPSQKLTKSDHRGD
ncbi:uncharacterized protein N7506_002154 [Penicillium brevicompactum]|uniref:uncharacterized protein n=1 Tax=Penicillium brevicompactum TaxID=5074 RepID=UPI00253F9881|nr:uncharacterized protein N7506_002154 [Penicillium brevicompactum]KAJ5348901.1 hypothetical protein N7506_002154 [Penicillium brevicompactum]